MKSLKINIIFILLLFGFVQKNIQAISFWSDYQAKNAYEKGDFNKVKEILEREQVDKPYDAQLNYNLGNAYYKLCKPEQAKSNFERAVNNCSEAQNDLKEFAYFNWGKSFYKNCLDQLGDNWEKKEIDEKKLDFAISEVKQAIEKYKNVMVLNKQNEKAKVNLEKAEEPLKKLEEKKQQQQQQKQDQQQEGGSESDKEGDGEQNDQQQQDRNEGSDKSEGDSQDGKKDELDEKQTGEKENGDSEHDKDSSLKDEQDQTSELEDKSKQDGEENQEKGEEEGQAVEMGDQPEESMKERGMKVILDNLQSDESKLQKRLILQKSKGDAQRLDSKQKPW